jgi:hypothetical protein
VRITTAFKRLLRLSGASVVDVSFTGQGVIVTARLRRRRRLRAVRPDRPALADPRPARQALAPDWLARGQRQAAACYLVAGDVVLPLDPCRRDPGVLVALTCVARGGLSELARQRRNMRRRRRPSRRVVPG